MCCLGTFAYLFSNGFVLAPPESVLSGPAYPFSISGSASALQSLKRSIFVPVAHLSSFVSFLSINGIWIIYGL